MAESLHGIQAFRWIEADVGHIALILSEAALAAVLIASNVEDATELPEEVWRNFCYTTSGAGLLHTLGMMEAMRPDSSVLTVENENEPTGVFRSSDMGYPLLRAMMPDVDATNAHLVDPQLSPVDFEVRVFDAAQPETENPATSMSRQLLRVTLQPPYLA